MKINRIASSGLIADQVKDEAYRAVSDFSHEIGNRVFEFVDFFDGGGTETYTARYLWCLYAIVWGIQQYDLATEKVLA